MTRYALQLIGFLIILAGASCDSSRQTGEDDKSASSSINDYQGVIVAMGDSLTAGLGVAPSESYPALLEHMLSEKGFAYRVINAGISGETSSGASSRIDWILKLKPDIVILETGANDGLRGIDPALIEENIERIILRLKQDDVMVVLAGMMMVTNLGETYVSGFNGIYPRLAQKHRLIFMPFFLKDVATEVSMNQGDGIHPNSAGYQVVVKNLLPFVLQAIENHQKER